MRTVSLADARATLGSLLDSIERGERVFISRKGRIVAELRPLEGHEGQLTMEGAAATVVVRGVGSLEVDSAQVQEILNATSMRQTRVQLRSMDGHVVVIPVSAIDHVRIPRLSELSTLTSRELQVIRLIAAGKSNRDIATMLTLSERTVEAHTANIYAKLNVTSRSAAVSAASHEALPDKPPFKIVSAAGYEFRSYDSAALTHLRNAASESPRLLEIMTLEGVVFLDPLTVCVLGTADSLSASAPA